MNNLTSKMGLSMHKLGFTLKKYSPEILITLGVIGTIASTVTACKATTKIDDILDETKNNVDLIRGSAGNPELAEIYTLEDSKKDLTIVYIQTGVKLAKLYAPSIALGAFSISCMLTSHNILSKRNAAIAAAYATVDKGFKEYRSRVVDRFGEEVDRELKYDIKAKKIDRIEVDEDGKKKKKKETIGIAGHSEYAHYFDKSCPGYRKDHAYNMMFLRAQQQYANDKLESVGYLFLSDVYKDLGLPVSSEDIKAGQVVGWIYDPENPKGDNYVDFGLHEAYSDDDEEYHERVILLDFNVDGNIWEMM